MGLTTDEIAAHPALPACIRRQSAALVQAFEANPRLASVFATQQRWLMAHLALALYFRSHDKGFKITEFLDLIDRHEVASRNTADTFVKEMLKYNFARIVRGANDRRARPIEPTEASLKEIQDWLVVHFATLDGLDGGRRAQTCHETPGLTTVIQPLIADALLSSPKVREPEKTFSLFTWLNNGGIVMDRIIAGIDEADAGSERIPTTITSVKEMAAWLHLSRSHLVRKLRDAEALGSIGWQGKRGQSVMWVSQGFRLEYTMAQAVKLAIIDQAYGLVTGV
ncbi:hypothetical protein G5V57_06250 [Nordella sp. HKS 07]|uniref:hypothetical protein n=1 Tax=Nordella sp. HKS 07 TaxID=2712222 RepID=UPI0013E1EED8|nr:hypothetical protein [Nordella sp. HKS 07]QIG47372.1 hypothetical protein G5V57_06250 [Nordella sp. HKS 07]